MMLTEIVHMEDWKMSEELTGVEIKVLRKGLGLTQEEFAHAVAVTFSTVNRWENGHAKPSKLARRAIEQLTASRPRAQVAQPSHSIDELATHRPTGTHLL
jgi:DNA-binding transcriptional regulator YiaG